MDDLKRVLRVWVDLGLSVAAGALLGLVVAAILVSLALVVWVFSSTTLNRHTEMPSQIPFHLSRPG
jgi:hypothetical protein